MTQPSRNRQGEGKRTTRKTTRPTSESLRKYGESETEEKWKGGGGSAFIQDPSTKDGREGGEALG